MANLPICLSVLLPFLVFWHTPGYVFPYVSDHMFSIMHFHACSPLLAGYELLQSKEGSQPVKYINSIKRSLL